NVKSFLKRLKRDSKKNFNFCTELEENEDELNKLYKWFEKVAQRDVFECEIEKRG
ncbi:hypothetical protein TheetDRAFT_2925, partial [Thermoanaerobacter ethanolicus JW 200]